MIYATEKTSALQHYLSGDFPQAQRLYQHFLEKNPEDADVLHMLGLIAHALEDPQQALFYFKSAIALGPERPDFHNSGGAAYLASDLPEIAEQCYRQALALQPDNGEIHFNLGLCLQLQQRTCQAVKCFEKAAQLQPNMLQAYLLLVELHSELGDYRSAINALLSAKNSSPDDPQFDLELNRLYLATGQPLLALSCAQNALKPDSTSIPAQYQLGRALLMLKRYADVRDVYSAILSNESEHIESWINLGIAYQHLDQLDGAEQCQRKALELQPESSIAYLNLGVILQLQGNLTEAIDCFNRAIAINPDFAESYNNLGNAFKALYSSKNAAYNYEIAFQLKPDFAEAYSNLGCIRREQGLLQEAITLYRKALECNPDHHLIHSNVLMDLNYSAQHTPEEIFQEHSRWAELHTSRILPCTNHNIHPEPNRRLKIGYLSPDLKAHSVAFFLEPLLEAHSPIEVETYCYAEVQKPDVTTARLQEKAHRWHFTCGLSDQQLAELIQSDGIDILVDLAGHTGNSRLRVLAYKPAPIQVTYLGYPNTTGMTQVDYRLTDEWADPLGAEAIHSEALVRLPDGFLCYQPPDYAPPVSPPPYLERDYVTFGSFNNLAKIVPEVVELWAAVLKAVPHSRLLLKSRSLLDESTQERYSRLFQQHGVERERLILQHWSSSPLDHLGYYSQVDIALDPFPYNGTTTTCEALLMGVPVITLAGKAHAGRVGVSLLSQLQLTELIAPTPEQYVQTAVDLACDPERLVVYREALRPWMALSPLCDGEGFARHVEAAYRQMWQQWCKQQS